MHTPEVHKLSMDVVRHDATWSVVQVFGKLELQEFNFFSPQILTCQTTHIEQQPFMDEEDYQL